MKTCHWTARGRWLDAMLEISHISYYISYCANNIPPELQPFCFKNIEANKVKHRCRFVNFFSCEMMLSWLFHMTTLGKYSNVGWPHGLFQLVLLVLFYIKCWVIAQSPQHTLCCANTESLSETVGVDWCDPWCRTNIHNVHMTQGKDLWGQCAEKHHIAPVFIFLPLWRCCLTFWKAELIFQICKVSMADGSSVSVSIGCWLH